MKIQQFIEKAIEGGWRSDEDIRDGWVYDKSGVIDYHLGRDIFLDPLAWKAVGRVEGWKQEYYEYGSANEAIEMAPYMVKMHRMIDALAEEKTIEQYLETL